MLGRRSSSLSSTPIFASSATTLPSGVLMSGLISASDPPASLKAWYSCCMIFAACRTCFTSSYSLNDSSIA